MNKPSWYVAPGYYFENKKFFLPPVTDKESNAKLMYYIRNGFHLEFIDLEDTPTEQFVIPESEVEDDNTFGIFLISSLYTIIYIITILGFIKEHNNETICGII